MIEIIQKEYTIPSYLNVCTKIKFRNTRCCRVSDAFIGEPFWNGAMKKSELKQ